MWNSIIFNTQIFNKTLFTLYEFFRGKMKDNQFCYGISCVSGFKHVGWAGPDHSGTMWQPRLLNCTGIMGGTGFAVVSSAREFSQIRLITALIITLLVCWDWKAHACNHTYKPHTGKRWTVPSQFHRSHSTLASPAMPYHKTGPSVWDCVRV